MKVAYLKLKRDDFEDKILPRFKLILPSIATPFLNREGKPSIVELFDALPMIYKS